MNRIITQWELLCGSIDVALSPTEWGFNRGASPPVKTQGFSERDVVLQRQSNDTLGAFICDDLHFILCRDDKYDYTFFACVCDKYYYKELEPNFRCKLVLLCGTLLQTVYNVCGKTSTADARRYVTAFENVYERIMNNADARPVAVEQNLGVSYVDGRFPKIAISFVNNTKSFCAELSNLPDMSLAAWL